MSETPSEQARHFFVDEAGDLTLFNKRGTVIIGREGVSQCFMVGLAIIPDPDHVAKTLNQLRADLLADPYFQGVPSMQPERKKTAVTFHAKDDLPEVRREVFKLLPTFGAKVIVAIRRKSRLVEEARALHASGQKIRDDDVYDNLVQRIFKDVLHKASENHIVFARRGKTKRTEALEDAIEKARAKFTRKWGIASDKDVHIDALYPSQSAGLQVIDYYLWALQRCYERSEARFFNVLQSDYRLIMDIDDTRNRPYGEWYKDSNILTLEKIKKPDKG